ncbi:hypothetical protein [Amycolatopsis samaneae]|uniref:Uncharacterized protein n=1 Tax=Amycolatopsis samaneae TaxID=664691 RepID=A0ABW5GU97_9PSEU
MRIVLTPKALFRIVVWCVVIACLAGAGVGARARPEPAPAPAPAVAPQ